jgi:hypothetical protein
MGRRAGSSPYSRRTEASRAVVDMPELSPGASRHCSGSMRMSRDLPRKRRNPGALSSNWKEETPRSASRKSTR